jgi:hypothetical protein
MISQQMLHVVNMQQSAVPAKVVLFHAARIAQNPNVDLKGPVMLPVQL